jgi:signal transduction histidine kinase
MSAKKQFSARSLSRRITAASAAWLFLCFFLLDLAVILFNAFRGGVVPEEGTGYAAALIARIREESGTPLLILLYCLEGVMLLLRTASMARSVGRSLEPVENLSRMAEQIGKPAAFNEERLRSVEKAIDEISPLAEDGALKTGDKELAGLETAVNSLIERMRESYSQQARFVSDASHELRTPIAVIKGYADMLDRWGKTDEAVLEESVQAIKSESENMSRLVEQLLFLARGDSGRTKLQREKVDLAHLMKEVCEESSMIDRDHVYEYLGEDAVPVRGDPSLLKQAARVLTDNAAKYSPQGEKITLRASREGKEAVFSVQDRGIGIPEESLPFMFDRFYRADNSRTRGSGGTGLGLAIAKWIVDRHGGYFDVVSFEGAGTRISVHLPAGNDPFSLRKPAEKKRRQKK